MQALRDQLDQGSETEFPSSQDYTASDDTATPNAGAHIKGFPAKSVTDMRQMLAADRQLQQELRKQQRQHIPEFFRADQQKP